MDLHLFLCFLILSEQPSLKATFLPNSSPSFTFHLSPFALQPIQSEDGGDNPDSVFLQLQGCRLNQTATVSIPIFYNVSPTAEPSWNVPWVGHYKMEHGTIDVMLTEMQRRKACVDGMATHRSPAETISSRPLGALQ